VLTTAVLSDDEPLGALQLFFPTAAAAAAARTGLASLALAAGGALGRAAVSRRRDEDLRRLSALVSIAANAAASASLEQTLAAVGAHVATLVPSSTVSVFVIDDGRPVLAEPPSATSTAHAAAVATLVRSDVSGAAVVVQDVAADERLAAIAADLAASGVASLVVVPLRFREAVIGAVSLVAGLRDAFRERDLEILARQAPPIALALGSAVLSAHSARLEQELSAVLASERSARGELDAQDMVVRAIAEGWGRTRAASAVARAAADLLGTDAAGVLLVDADGAISVEALHVASPALAEPVRRIVRRVPTLLPAATLESLRGGRSSILEGGQLAEGGSLLGPLLAPGASAGLVPLRPESELSAILVVVSLDPARPIDADRLGRAERFAAQAALAVRG
jgi:GAF domain-containing protein